MEWGAASTVIAAAIGFAGLAYQQSRHWKETRRDKVREAYAEWMSALSHARRAEERFLRVAILGHDELRARAAAGDPLAKAGALVLTAERAHEMRMVEQEIDARNRELDIAFGRVCLLDRDLRRVAAAQAVSNLQTLDILRPGERPSEEAFDERWNVKSRALWELAVLINRTLALEGRPAFLWDLLERVEEQEQEELHARMKTTRSGTPERLH